MMIEINIKIDNVDCLHFVFDNPKQALEALKDLFYGLWQDEKKDKWKDSEIK